MSVRAINQPGPRATIRLSQACAKDVGALSRLEQSAFAGDHWQILKHSADGKHEEGRTETVAIKDTPKTVLEAAVRCAKLVGDGLYGVDLKENASGVYVIEINDNPNIDAGMEDAMLGDELYRKLLGHLLRQFEAPHQDAPTSVAAVPIDASAPALLQRDRIKRGTGENP